MWPPASDVKRSRASRLSTCWSRGGSGRLCVHITHDPHLLGGERAFPAQIAGEGEPPAQHGPEPVAVPGEEADVDEQPDDPPGETGELQPAHRDHGAAAGE